MTVLRSPRLRVRFGNTLLEVAVAIPIIAMLLAGMSSSLKMAGLGVPDGTSTTSASLAATRVMDLLAGDIRYATTVNTNTSTELVFSVSDRTGNGLPETIRYYWSGATGSSLTRQCKVDQIPPIQWSAVPANTIATTVQELSFDYDKRPLPISGGYSMGPEVLLASSNGNFNDDDDMPITNSNWIGQYFAPALPNGTVSWKPTRVAFYAMKDSGSNGLTSIQIRPALNGLPTNTVLDQATMSESNLKNSYVLQSFSLGNVPEQVPGTGLCLIFQIAANPVSCDIQTLSVSSPSSQMVTTSNAGASWTSSQGSVCHYIYGTLKTSVPATYQYNLTAVHCKLRLASNPQSRITTSVAVLNEPPVAGP